MRSCTEDGKVFQMLGRAETRKAREPKLRMWRGTDSNKVAEKRKDLVGLWCCKVRRRTSTTMYHFMS